MRNTAKFVARVGIMLSAVAAVPANAAVVFDATTIGSAIAVNYNGFDNPDGAGGTLTGLNAKGTFTLSSIVGSTFAFNYSMANTSTAPVLTSRISVFGFNVSPFVDTDPDIASNITTPAVLFTDLGYQSNVPNLTGSDLNRICFRAGGGGTGCSGGGGGGVAIGDTQSGAFSLTFDAGTSSIELDKFFVRYQSLSSTAFSAESATGLGTPSSAVPEPATWGMMIIGFGLIGGFMRRRWRKSVNPSFA